jgi:hypothetical protein
VLAERGKKAGADAQVRVCICVFARCASVHDGGVDAKVLTLLLLFNSCTCNMLAGRVGRRREAVEEQGEGGLSRTGVSTITCLPIATVCRKGYGTASASCPPGAAKSR